MQLDVRHLLRVVYSFLYELKLDREEIAAILIFEGYRFKRFVSCGILTTLDDVSIHEG